MGLGSCLLELEQWATSEKEYANCVSGTWRVMGGGSGEFGPKWAAKGPKERIGLEMEPGVGLPKFGRQWLCGLRGRGGQRLQGRSQMARGWCWGPGVRSFLQIPASRPHTFPGPGTRTQTFRKQLLLEACGISYFPGYVDPRDDAKIWPAGLHAPSLPLPVPFQPLWPLRRGCLPLPALHGAVGPGPGVPGTS